MLLIERCRAAAAAWQTGGQTFVHKSGLKISHADAVDMLKRLSDLLIEYNNRMWEDFPYCRDCLGKCCTRVATRIETLDGAAVALLGLQDPVIPDPLFFSGMQCIYMSQTGCTWQGIWRPIKCWMYFCLGPQPSMSNDEINRRYEELSNALALPVEAMLPAPLARMAQRSPDYARTGIKGMVTYPNGFSQWLVDVTDELFAQPMLALLPENLPAD